MYILLDFFASAWGVLRSLLLFIDSVGITFIDNAYDLLIKAMNAFDGTVVKEIATNIAHNVYVIIGIFALFRIAVILVNTIINPDKLTDKESGFGNVLGRFVITICLFVVVPFIFDASRTLQSKIMDNNYISKVIIGTNLTDDTEGPGKVMKDLAVRALIHPDDRYEKIATKNDDNTYSSSGECSAAVESWNNDAGIETLTRFIGDYDEVDGENIYCYSYTPFVTLLVGGFMTYVLLSFAIDIAVRSVELLALEILAPLFIVTFIDPKSGSNGAFKKWTKTCMNTFVSLFIKVGIVCLMLLFMTNLKRLMSANDNNSMFLNLLMMIAILIFAKKAPKWIGDMLGVEGGLGELGIGKKLAGAALVGGAIGKGMEASKKFLGNRAKRTGAGIVNRLGADIGGSYAGRRAARQNALGDKSYREIRDNQGRGAALRSFFSADDRRERRRRLEDADGELKDGAKQGRLDARVRATQAALDGKFKFAPGLAQGVMQTYDPGYQTRDDRRLRNAEKKALDNQGFDLAAINKQKDLQEKANLATEMTGHRHTIGNDGKTIIDTVTGQPATFNGKTLKSNYGSTVASWEDMAAINLGGKSAFITSSEIKLADGSKILAGSVVTKNADGSYKKVADASEVDAESEKIQSSYTKYGKKEMEAVFAERKAENASSFVQTQQLINQTNQNIAKFELDLAPLTEKLGQLKKLNAEMVEKLKSLKKKKDNTSDLSEKTSLQDQIENLTNNIKQNNNEQLEIENRKKPVEDYLEGQRTLIGQLQNQSLLYNNPDNPISLDGVSLNLANEGEIQFRLNKDKEDKRKEADAAKPSFKSSGNSE